MNYNFYVKDAKDVDIQRILTEAPAECEALMLVGGCNAALVLRNSFLTRFDPSDKIEISECLWSGWGRSELCGFNHEGGVGFAVGNSDVIEGWRAISLEKSGIPEAIAQLRAAQAFAPRREVRVTYL